MNEDLAAFLEGRHATWRSDLHGRTGDLEVTTYLCSDQPPPQFVMSSRAVVLSGDTVLLIEDPERFHVLPGGRVDSGEALEGTALREVLEETGWQVELLGTIGVRHIHWLSPRPAAFADGPPDFLQVVFAAEALRDLPGARDTEGYELGAAFVPLTELPQLTEEEYRLIDAAVVARSSR